MPNSTLLRQTVVVYSVHEARRSTFDLVLAPHTDLDRATSVITDALAGAPIIVSNPAPDVVASEVDANAVRLTVCVWYPSGMISDEPALDAAIRATYAALDDAGLELQVLTSRSSNRQRANPPTVVGDPVTAASSSWPLGSRSSAPER